MYRNMPKRRLGRGYTLIEVLVAMAVSGILLNALIQVFMSNSAASRTIVGFSSLQENARTALHDLTHSFRLAGHYGGIDKDDIAIIGSVNVTGVGSCNNSWILNTDSPIQGFEGASAIASVTGFPLGCIPTDQYVPNSDLVVMRYGSSLNATPLASLSASKVYLRTAIGSGGIDGGEILLGSDKSSSTVGSGVDAVGTYNYEYKTELYFLRPCSALNGTECTNGISTLMRYKIEGSTFSLEPIAEGVEQFQIEYGVDTKDESGNISKRDYVADVYQTATNVSNWADVVSARFSLVIRSENSDNAINDTQTYALAGDFDYKPASDDANYSRKIFTKVVQLRNMSRG